MQRPAFIVALVVAAAILSGPGCGSGAEECRPGCRDGFECFHGVCLPFSDASGDGAGDADASADADADYEPGDGDEGPTDGEDVPDGTLCTGGSVRCAADLAALQRCRGDGSAWDSEVCRFRCGPDPTPHCLEWSVSNVPDGSLLSAGEPPATPFSLPAGDTYFLDLDTNSGSAVVHDEAWGEVMTVRPGGVEGPHAPSGIHFRVLAQGGGAPDLAVFSFQNLHVPSNVIVTAGGSRALVLLSQEDAVIDGGVFVGCWDNDLPPTAGARESGMGPGHGMDGAPLRDGENVRDGGGGGGAFGGPGGEGGGYRPELRGLAGSTYGAASLTPLESGSGGGWGSDRTGGGGRGGTSGGAVEIVSGTSVAVNGWIDAGGCGGRSTYDRRNEGGGGGGSGGGILIESPRVAVAGAVTANGGGGGAGGEGAWDGSSDGSGADTGTADPAAGGREVTGYACDGGDGSGGAGIGGINAPTCDGGPDDFNAGGGGGGAGRIRVNGTSRDLAGTVSPDVGSDAATEGDLPLR